MSAPGKLVRSSRWKSGPSKGQRPLGSECCVPPGDSGHEAYTAIAWGVGLSHERSDIAGAESFHSLEGNMCGTAMRGADALPGSKATSHAKGSHRKLGGLGSGHRCRVGAEYDGPHREGEEPKPMMHGPEKSDLAIVAGKSANKVAPRCGAIRGGASRSGVDGAKVGAVCGKAARTVLCGGRAMKRASLPLRRRDSQPATISNARRNGVTE